MKHLLIIGARGFGREIYNISQESIGYGTVWDVKGFLDDNFNALDGYEDYPAIIDCVENYGIQKDDVFICALGDVHYKKKYVDIILSKGGEFINIIHKSARIERNTVFGKGCIFCNNANISCDIKIGDFVTIQPFSAIGHDAKIGSFCHLNTYCFMGGFSEIGDFVTMNTASILHPKKKITDDVVVGAGSFVIKNIKKSGITVVGNPAIEL